MFSLPRELNNSNTMEVIKVLMYIASLIALASVVHIPLTETRNETEPFESTDSTLQPPQPYVNSKTMKQWLLAHNNNPRGSAAAADKCNKDNSICYGRQGTNAATCCNNKCIDVQNDRQNCGACKNKCKFANTCCGGECVNMASDKRHCGQCNNLCREGGSCGNGMCDYA